MVSSSTSYQIICVTSCLMYYSLINYIIIPFRQCRQIAEIVNAAIQPLQNSAVREYLVEISGNKALEKLWTDRYVVKGLQGASL